MGVKDTEGPNWDGTQGEIVISRDGKRITVMHPQKRRYWVQGSVMTEAGIQTIAGRNVFVALGEDLGAGRWSVRAQVRPLMEFVWAAALLMAIGGAISISDRRYRSARAPAAAPADGTIAAGESSK
jgi:cytochrome c-type biogenesis protein CcmF